MKTSTESLSHRFHRIVSENLPKRLEMMNVLLENPLDNKLFSTKGQGLNTILKELGRIQDFKGVYGFVLDGRVVYLDESSYVLKRILRQYKGTTKYQQQLLHLIDAARKEISPTDSLSIAKEQMSQMGIVIMEIPDDLERELTAVYLKCELDCLYNRYE